MKNDFFRLKSFRTDFKKTFEMRVNIRNKHNINYLRNSFWRLRNKRDFPIVSLFSPILLVGNTPLNTIHL